MKTFNELNRLRQILTAPELPRAESEWGGADVVISAKPEPPLSKDAFYPEPRWVETPYALELSRLFEKLRDAFYAEDRIDSCSKIEFFGRLANAAIRCNGNSTQEITARLLCAAVLDEAFVMYKEMDEGTFGVLNIATDNEIADDDAD